jgi:hypothetical protein
VSTSIPITDKQLSEVFERAFDLGYRAHAANISPTECSASVAFFNSELVQAVSADNSHARGVWWNGYDLAKKHANEAATGRLAACADHARRYLTLTNSEQANDSTRRH